MKSLKKSRRNLPQARVHVTLAEEQQATAGIALHAFVGSLLLPVQGHKIPFS